MLTQEDIRKDISELKHKLFDIELALGNITGYSKTAFAGNSNLVNTVETTLVPWGEQYHFLDEDTQLYASSSDNSDSCYIYILGMDDDYNEVGRLVVLNGQTKTAVTGLLFRVFEIYVISSSQNLGDIYIYEDDTVSGGVPQTATKIHGKIIAGYAAGHNAIRTTPAGKSMYMYDLEGSVSKAKDASIFIWFRSYDGPWVASPAFEIYQNPFRYSAGFLIGEKTDVRINATSEDSNTRSTVSFNLILIDN